MTGYTEAMRQSIARVEATRARRLEETFPHIPEAERAALLRAFHPDYAEGAFAALRVGPNKSDRAPRELAAVLEGRAWVDPDAIDLTQVDADCDVLVIGGGGAGASAALLAQEHGADVLLATKLRFGDANTMMAQGGIQAADKPGDSPAEHYLDVIGGGRFANDPDLVEALVMDAPGVIAWLEALGVMFDKEPDGTMVTIHGGGTSRKRMHSARDYSGAEIMRTLRDEVRSRPVRVLEYHPAVELLTDGEGRVTGAVLLDLDTNATRLVRARAVVIATGGSGRLHYQGFPTTNHYGATGDGLALAYRAGARLAFIDTMQYHPTGAAYPEQILGLLVTEKVRGLGAQVCNAAGAQFCHPLEPRDVEAACIVRECGARGAGVSTPAGQQGVWLDAPMIDLIHGPGAIAHALPAMVRQFQRFGIDITREPILVYPTLHYQNGGVAIHPDASTGVPGLYVAGEAAGGIHGRNRLMGNSLLDVCVFGRRAGVSAAAYAREAAPGDLTLGHVRAWHAALDAAGAACAAARSPVLLPDYTRRQRDTVAER
ncbi:MAG: hypothetical protein Kow00120_02210 [Anaerolineae bacterium]